MNIRISSITLALLLILNSVVLAETTTQYKVDGNDSDTAILYLEKDVVNDETKIEFPNAEVLSASYAVSGGADQDGNYPEDISITISGNIISVCPNISKFLKISGNILLVRMIIPKMYRH